MSWKDLEKMPLDKKIWLQTHTSMGLQGGEEYNVIDF
jgi:hypothetical protein